MRKWLIGVLVLLLTLLLYLAYTIFWETEAKVNARRYVPEHSIYFIESNQALKNWEEIKKTEAWNHLQTNRFFADLTSNIIYFDSLSEAYPKLLGSLNNRDVIISAQKHRGDDYDFLFVIDLKEISNLLKINSLFEKVLGKNYSIKTLTFQTKEFLEVLDLHTNEKFYIAFDNHILLCAFAESSIKASLDASSSSPFLKEASFLELHEKVNNKGLMRIYLQYAYLDDWANIYLDEPNTYLEALGEMLKYAAFRFDIKEGGKQLSLDGYSNLIGHNAEISALMKSGNGEMEAQEVIPINTAFYVSLGFNSFQEYYENWSVAMKKERPDEFATYQNLIKKTEKFLNVSLQELLLDWIDDEIAFVQTEPSNGDDFALVIKSKDLGESEKALAKLADKLRSRTPIKVKKIYYQNHEIHFLSMKGFFKLFFGSFFEKLDKPYYTFIDDYVIFSNQPRTLKHFINSYESKNTLDRFPEFDDFVDEFSGKSNFFLYSNNALLFNKLFQWVDQSYQAVLLQNKDYINAFPQLGIQLDINSDVVRTQVQMQYADLGDVNWFANPNIPTTDSYKFKVFAPLDSIAVDLSLVFEEDEMIVVEEISPADLDAERFMEYYEDGSIRIEVPLKDGLKHGTFRQYYPNGDIQIKGRYKRDKRVGTWKEFDLQGKTIKKEKI